MRTEFLRNKIRENSKHTDPWIYWQFDNFLPTVEFKRIQDSLCSIDSNFRKRDDDDADINFMFLPDLKLAKFFLSENFCEFLENLTGEKLEIYTKGLVQLRRMDASSPAFPNHIDSQDERSLVCLLYISPDWANEKGGELCLHKSEVINACDVTVIAPIENRMVLFFSDDTHWHSVNRVQDWSRYTVISEWIVQSKENV